MKNTIKLNGVNLLVVLALLFAFCSCSQDKVIPPSVEQGNEDTVNTPADSIADLSMDSVKSFYQGEDIKLDQIFQNYKQVNISGSVISDPQSNNTPEAYLILQNEEEGIALLIRNLTENITYNINEVLQVNVQNGTLRKIDGNYIITGLSLSDITRTGNFDTIKPRTVNLKELAENFDEYNETLVKLNMVGITPTPVSGETLSGTKGLDDGSTNPGLIKLYTFSDAKFSERALNPHLKINAAIAMYNKNDEDQLEKQIWLRDEKEISNIIPFNSPIVITGFLANPTNGDQATPGTTKPYLSEPLKGGFEYIQLMAKEDIDFSQTPYSLVTMISYSGRHGATDKGWARGWFITVKFDLTSGSAKKGQFFYVGSGETIMDGYWGSVADGVGGKSTDISQVNWIYNKPFWSGDYDDYVGNPFEDGTYGQGTASWLDNRNDAGSDGIAIFKGTTVGKDSVPIDAVFFNEDIGGTYDAGNHYGFLVPKNDLYSPVNPNTGDPQPLFGEGTNTWAVPASIANADGMWTALGGIVSPDGIIEKRKATGVQLYVENGKSQLSDIEEGEGITKFRN